MICIAWQGFPQYAARCVAAFVRTSKEKVIVVATTPSVPIKGMEDIVGCPIKWITHDKKPDIKELCGEYPRLLLVSGWGATLFNQIRDQVRNHGGFVVAACDNNYIFSFYEIVRSIRFRLFFKRKYDAFFVPGLSGRKLLKFYGVADERIIEGLYSADETLFKNGSSILERDKRIIFVGRLDKRKNVVSLCEAFKRSNGNSKGWTLDLYGFGPLKDQLTIGDGISIHDFVQPEELSLIYQNARCFILPSLKEHWGLVVHEAALSGCYLLLSHVIGAADDFLGKDNGVKFDSGNIDSMIESLEKVFSLTDDEWVVAQKESLELASRHGLSSFVGGMKEFLSMSEEV